MNKLFLGPLIALSIFFNHLLIAQVPTENSVTQNTQISSSNYLTIYTYITQNYKKISTHNAHIISYEICKQTQQCNLDPLLFASIIAVESRFNHEAIGGGNASGLGQLMPGTYRHYKVSNPFDIADNIGGMCRYITDIRKSWESKPNSQTLILVSYNRGTTYVKRHLNTLTDKALKYSDKVMAHYKKLQENSNNIEIESVLGENSLLQFSK